MTLVKSSFFCFAILLEPTDINTLLTQPIDLGKCGSVQHVMDPSSFFFTMPVGQWHIARAPICVTPFTSTGMQRLWMMARNTVAELICNADRLLTVIDLALQMAFAINAFVPEVLSGLWKLSFRIVDSEMCNVFSFHLGHDTRIQFLDKDPSRCSDMVMCSIRRAKKVWTTQTLPMLLENKRHFNENGKRTCNKCRKWKNLFPVSENYFLCTRHFQEVLNTFS